MLGRIAIDLTKDGNHVRRLDTTLRLAKTHEAEVVGVYPCPASTEYLRGGNSMPPEVSNMVRGHLLEQRTEMQELFKTRTQDAGVRATWRQPQGFAEEVLALHARYCDLLVMSQSEKQTSSLRASLAETVITNRQAYFVLLGQRPTRSQGTGRCRPDPAAGQRSCRPDY